MRCSQPALSIACQSGLTCVTSSSMRVPLSLERSELACHGPVELPGSGRVEAAERADGLGASRTPASLDQRTAPRGTARVARDGRCAEDYRAGMSADDTPSHP